MLSAILKKEVRELLPFIVLAIIAQSYLVCAAIGMRMPLFSQGTGGVIPFIGSNAIDYTHFVSGIFAIVIGLWQTWWESSRGTLLFLLHRPLERNHIFGAKLALGSVLCLTVSTLPIAVYALWAATPGTHASPFDWSMTTGAWRIGAAMPLLYFAAFMSGLRPAHLFGSRFFPLASGLLAVVAIGAASYALLMVPLSLAVAACFLWIIFRVAATRDYS